MPPCTLTCALTCTLSIFVIVQRIHEIIISSMDKLLWLWLIVTVWWRVHSSTGGTSGTAETRGENQRTWNRNQTATNTGNKTKLH